MGGGGGVRGVGGKFEKGPIWKNPVTECWRRWDAKSSKHSRQKRKHQTESTETVKTNCVSSQMTYFKLTYVKCCVSNEVKKRHFFLTWSLVQSVILRFDWSILTIKRIWVHSSYCLSIQFAPALPALWATDTQHCTVYNVLLLYTVVQKLQRYYSSTLGSGLVKGSMEPLILRVYCTLGYWILLWSVMCACTSAR